MTDTHTSADAMENAVLARSARCAEEAFDCAEDQPLPQAVAQKTPEQKSPAEWAYQRIILYIQNFEKQLDGDHEVGMGFAGGDVGTLRIQSMGFFAPDLISFYGVDQHGARTQLVQHVSQLNVMLKAAPKLQDEPARIGFRLAQTLEEAE